MNYLLVGTETYNLQKRRDAIIRETGCDPVNVSIYRGREWTMAEVIEDCQTLPFLSEGKVVIIENPDFLYNHKENDEDFNRLCRYLEHSLLETTLIVYVDGALDRTKANYKKLIKLMRYESFEPLKEEEFRHVVKADINKARIQIEPSALTELLNRLPADLTNWKSELEKLSCYPGKITMDVVKQLVARPIEEDVFQLSNAVTSRNLSRSIQIYRDLLVNNRNDVKGLIGLLAAQFRFMSRILTLSEKGNTVQDIADRYGYNEYRVKIGLRNCRGLSSEQLLNLLNRLSNLDQDILAGKVDGKLGLELFIMEACR